MILFDEGEVDPDGRIVLRGRRARHVVEVHRATVGDRLRVGVIGGRLGEGLVRFVGEEEVSIETTLDTDPPPALGIDLLLALPRPKMLKKLLPAIAALGVKRIVLVNAARVEKGYFTSPALEAAALREALILGLEQARDTSLPQVTVRERFRPFVEDEVETLWPSPCVRLVGHPTASQPIEKVECGDTSSKLVTAIGPEGGWVPFEIDLLEKQGFQTFSVGRRVLRVDTAVTAILAQLELLRRIRSGGEPHVL